MARSIWKSPYIDLNIIKRFDELLTISVEQFKQQYNFGDEELTRKFLKQNKVDISFIAKKTF